LVLIVPDVIDGVARGVSVPNEVPAIDVHILGRREILVREGIPSRGVHCLYARRSAVERSPELAQTRLGLLHPGQTVVEVTVSIVDLSSVEHPRVVGDRRNGTRQRRVRLDGKQKRSVDVEVVARGVGGDLVAELGYSRYALAHDRRQRERPADAGEADAR
jgi:hypothetical protein